MPVGLVVPTLRLSIQISLYIILVTCILTRSWKLLLIGSSLLLVCCLFALAKFIYKKINAPTPEASEEEDEEDSEEEDTV